MKLIVNLLLLLLILGLGYLLYNSIKEPIQFETQKNRREAAVIDKLIKIREAQDLYRQVTGTFAPNFDTLVQVLQNGTFYVINVKGDPDATDGSSVIYDTTAVQAIDSIRSWGIDLSTIADVPYGDGAKFNINADTTTYQSTLVNVVEVGIPRKVFMGPWGHPRFAQYDNRFDPNSIIKFGDMNSPNTSGNWE